MHVTLLGTGSVGATERARSGLLVEEDAVLVDCGPGTFGNLARSRVAPDAVETVLFTHAHPDHVLDFVALLNATTPGGEDDLRVYGPPGTRAAVEGVLAPFEGLADIVDFGVTEFEPGDPVPALDRDVRTFATDHDVPSTAYRFDDRLAVSGDTPPMSGLVDFADGCDLLVHECSFFEEGDYPHHTTPAGLGEVLADCDAREVVLTHLPPHDPAARARAVRTVGEEFDGAVTVGRDMDRFAALDGR